MKITFRKLFVVVPLLVFSQLSQAQNTFPASGSVGIGTTAPTASSLLEIKSTTKGVLLPRMTKVQRDLIVGPVNGLLIYQTDSQKGFYYYNGTIWKPVTDNSVTGLSNNIFIGSTAGTSNTTGIRNIGFGRGALNGNTDRIENIAIGDSSQFVTGIGSIGNQAYYNSSVGSKSLRFNTTGARNASLGAYSSYYNITGNDNVAIGYFASYENKYANFCTAVGTSALQANQSTYNTGVGASAGSVVTFSSECAFFGYDADQSGAGPYINATAIGASSRISGDAQVRIGNSAVSSIGGFANFTNVSDGRFKKEIKQNVPGLDFINKLKPVTYNLDVRGLRTFLHEDQTGEANTTDEPGYKARIEKGIVAKEKILYSGFVAQEVEQAAKESGYDFSGVDKPQNEDGLYGLRYAEFTVPLVKAVQELSSADQKKEERINKLEKENAELLATVKQMQACLQQLCENNLKTELAPADPSSPQLHISPNPASGIVKITLGDADSKQSYLLKVIDISGKIIQSSTLNGNSTFEFNTSVLSKGSYMVQLFNQNELIQTEKLIIQ